MSEPLPDPPADRPEGDHGRCKSCGAGVLWVVTDTGKKMPLDEPFPIVPDPHGAFTGFDKWGRARRGYDGTGDHRAVNVGASHFATCPNADHHRKKG